MKIKVKVTEEHIERSADCTTLLGYEGSGTLSVIDNCLIQQAVREIFPECQVGNRIYTCYNDFEGIQLPSNALSRLYLFDKLTPEERRQQLKPFEFEIEVTPEIINQINISQVYKILSESKTLECVSI